MKIFIHNLGSKMSGQSTPNLPSATVVRSPRLRPEDRGPEHDFGGGARKRNGSGTPDTTWSLPKRGRSREREDVVRLDVGDSPKVTGAPLLRGPIHGDEDAWNPFLGRHPASSPLSVTRVGQDSRLLTDRFAHVSFRTESSARREPQCTIDSRK